MLTFDDKIEITAYGYAYMRLIIFILLACNKINLTDNNFQKILLKLYLGANSE